MAEQAAVQESVKEEEVIENEEENIDPLINEEEAGGEVIDKKPEDKAPIEEPKLPSDFDEMKKKVALFDQLTANESFRQWYRDQSQPKKEELPELSDEEYQSILSDKSKFRNYIQGLSRKVAENELLPKLNNSQMEVQVLKKQVEIERFGSDHPDFWELDKQGLIEPIMRKYPNMSLEDVYNLANKKTLESRATEKAHGIVTNKRRGIVEKPSGFRSEPKSKVSAKTREEYMQIVYREAKAGRPIPEWDNEG